jgi:hypothetical protein
MPPLEGSPGVCWSSSGPSCPLAMRIARQNSLCSRLERVQNPRSHAPASRQCPVVSPERAWKPPGPTVYRGVWRPESALGRELKVPMGTLSSLTLRGLGHHSIRSNCHSGENSPSQFPAPLWIGPRAFPRFPELPQAPPSSPTTREW